MTVSRRRILAGSAAAGAMLAAPAIVSAQATTIELWTFLDPNGRGVRSELLKEILQKKKKKGKIHEVRVIEESETASGFSDNLETLDGIGYGITITD